MRVDQIRLDGVRHFAPSETIRVRQDLTLLVGANGSGKSTVLDALCFALGDRTPDDFLNGDSSPVVTLYLVDDDAPVVIRTRVDDRRKRVVEQQARVALDLPKGAEKSTAAELKTFVGDVGKKATKPELVQLAATKLAQLDDDQFSDEWAPLTPQMQEKLPRVTRVDAESMIDVKKSVDDLFSRELQKFMASNRETWAGLNEQFLEAASPMTEALTKAVAEQAGDVVDSFAATATISTDRPRVDTSITATFEGTEVNLDALSLGKRRRIALSVADALTGRLGDRPEILLYDEPDAHLDNRSQFQLLQVLREQAGVGEVQVVVATHAPSVIDAVDVIDLVHVQARDGQATVRNFVDLVEDEDGLLVDLDSDLGNTALLHQRVLVVCEGVSEHAALPVLYRKRFGRSLKADGIELVSKDGATDAIRFALMLTSVRDEGVVLLLDRDQESQAEKSLMGVGLEATYVGEKELEDCFSNKTWAKVIAEFAAAEGVQVTITDEDVAKLRTHESKAFSKAMDAFLYDKSLTPSKPSLVKRAAEIQPDEVPLTGDLDKALALIWTAAHAPPRNNSDRSSNV